MSTLYRNIALVVGFLLMAFLVYYFSSIVAYVLIAWVLSMIGQPLMDFFQQKLHFDRIKSGVNLSAILVIIIYFLVASLLIWLFVPLIIQQAANIGAVDIKSIANTLSPPIEQLNNWLVQMGWEGQITDPEEQLRESFFKYFDPTQVATFFSSLISVAAGLIIDIFSIVFITFFFLREQGLFVDFLISIMPSRFESHTIRAVDDASVLLTRYFGGILFQVTIITIIVSLGLSLFGIKNALLIGFFAALINVIPYVGPIIGAVFGTFVTISSNLDVDYYNILLPKIIKVVSVFAFMQLTDNFILQPFIFSNRVRAHPLEIFIVILMGATINGIMGMVLAIPTYTVLRVLARVFLSEYRVVQRLTKGMDRKEE